MLFENNIPFLIAKFLITCLGTIGMAFSTIDFRRIKKRKDDVTR